MALPALGPNGPSGREHPFAKGIESHMDLDAEEAALMLPGEPAPQAPMIVGISSEPFEGLGHLQLDALLDRHRAELRAHYLHALRNISKLSRQQLEEADDYHSKQGGFPSSLSPIQPSSPTLPKRTAAEGALTTGSPQGGRTLQWQETLETEVWKERSKGSDEKQGVAPPATIVVTAAGDASRAHSPVSPANPPVDTGLSPKAPPPTEHGADHEGEAEHEGDGSSKLLKSEDQSWQAARLSEDVGEGTRGSTWDERRRISVTTGRPRSRASTMLHSPTFDMAVGIMVMISALVVGFDVEYCASRTTDVPAPFFQVCMYFFCIAFTLELILRIAVDGQKFFTSREWGWNWFDTFAVALNICEAIIINIAPGGRPLLVLSRLVRIVRVVRVIRIFRALSQLKLMILSIMSTLRALFWSIVLMCMCAYLCSVCLTQATTNHLVELRENGEYPDYMNDLQDNWGSVSSTGYTLFKSVMGGVSWGDPLESLLKLHWVYFLVFVCYLCFTLFAFFNVMTGFFCENAMDLANQDKDAIIQEQLKNKAKYILEFKRLFASLDEDGSGEVSYDELEKNLHSEELKAYFNHLNLDIERAQDIFRLLDKDMSGSITAEEFVEGCLQLRGSASKIDIATVGYQVLKVNMLLGDIFGKDMGRRSRQSGASATRSDPSSSLGAHTPRQQQLQLMRGIV